MTKKGLEEREIIKNGNNRIIRYIRYFDENSRKKVKRKHMKKKMKSSSAKDINTRKKHVDVRI